MDTDPKDPPPANTGFACVFTHTNTHWQAHTLQHWAMCVSSLGGGSTFCFHLVSPWIHSLPQLCSSSSNRHRPLFSLLHLAPSLCWGGAFDVQFWGSQGVIWGLWGWEGFGSGQPQADINDEQLNHCLLWEMANSWDALQALWRLPLDNAGWKSLSHLILFLWLSLYVSHFLYPERKHWSDIFRWTLIETDVHCTNTVWWCKCV